MGWLVRYDPLPYGVTPDAYLRSICEHWKDGHGTKILASSFVGTTWYAAAEITPADFTVPSFVVAFIFLTSGGRQKFGYKDMDESVGPVETDCPLYILDMLSPLDCLPGGDARGWAQKWRDACRASAVRRREVAAKVRNLVPGTRLRMAEPLSFNGVLIQDFKIVHKPARVRGIIAVRDDGNFGGGLYRLRAEEVAKATVVEEAKQCANR